MSLDERMRAGVREVAASPPIDSPMAWEEVRMKAQKQTRRNVTLMAVAASVVVIAGVVWGPGVLDSLTSQDDIQPIEQPSEPVEQSIHADGDWVRVDDRGLEASNGLAAVTEVDGRLIGVGGDWPRGVGVLTSTDGFTWTPAVTPSWGWPSDAIRGGPGVIAAGGRRFVWTSPDGLAWTPADLPVEAPYVNAEISAITVGESGLVAVGSRSSDTWPDAAVWTSADGLTWDIVTDESLGGPWRQKIDDVTQFGTGLVAVGSVDAGPLDPGESQDPPPAGIDPAEVGQRAAVWTSVDGTSWARVPHDPAVFSAAPRVTMRMVVAGGPGLVAVGTEEYPERDGGNQTVVWTSVDGQTWTRVPEQQHGLDGWISRVVTIGGELIAVGLDSREGAGMWTSVDGVTWVRVSDEDFSGPTPGPMITDVIQTDAGLLAVGATDGDFGVTGRPSTAVVWVLERP